MFNCENCGCETSDLFLFNDVEMCNECFETLVRVSKYNSYNDLNDAEKQCIMNYLRKTVEKMIIVNE